MNLANKTVVLTGASGGIGQAIAQQFAQSGARLILVGRNELALNKLLQDLPGKSRHHCCIKLDLGNDEGIDELVKFCRELPGGIDVLVNNAGINDFGMAENLDREFTQRLFFINLITPTILCSQLLPELNSRQEALIVNIGSVFGAIGSPGFTTYCASKAGLSRFSEALKRELADSNIQVLHLNPRATETEMNIATVSELNKDLGVSTDSPQTVARILLKKIQLNDFSESSIGWPEKLFVKINALAPGLVSKSLTKSLPRIKQGAASLTNLSKLTL